MRKPHILFSALGFVLALSACASAAVPEPSGQPGPEESPTVETPAKLNDALLYETYVDVSALPTLDIDMDDICVFEDRTLTLEDLIQNEPELLTYNIQYYIASAQFDRLMDLVGEEPDIQIAMNNEGVNFEAGQYMLEYTIHTVDTLTAEDLQNAEDYIKEDILNLIHTYNFEEYVVTEAEVSWRYNQAFLESGPQLEDGIKYMRYYLFAKTAQDSEFKLYASYWEDFFPN